MLISLFYVGLMKFSTNQFVINFYPTKIVLILILAPILDWASSWKCSLGLKDMKGGPFNSFIFTNLCHVRWM